MNHVIRNYIVLVIVLAGLATSCAEPGSEAVDEPDAGLVEKVYCPQCELYCKSVCYKKRYDNTLACTNDAYYSYCQYRCGVDVDALPELCIEEYLAMQSCILNGRSPVYVCSTNGQPVLRESWRCMGASFALSYCKANAPY